MINLGDRWLVDEIETWLRDHVDLELNCWINRIKRPQPSHRSASWSWQESRWWPVSPWSFILGHSLLDMIPADFKLLIDGHHSAVCLTEKIMIRTSRHLIVNHRSTKTPPP